MGTLCMKKQNNFIVTTFRFNYKHINIDLRLIHNLLAYCIIFSVKILLTSHILNTL